MKALPGRQGIVPTHLLVAVTLRCVGNIDGRVVETSGNTYYFEHEIQTKEVRVSARPSEWLGPQQFPTLPRRAEESEFSEPRDWPH